MSPVDRVLGLLHGVHESKNGWSARCPAHDDKNPSLSVKEGDDGRALLHCHAGCSFESICAAVGITVQDLFPTPGSEPRSSWPRHTAGKESAGYATAEDAIRIVTASVQRERGSDWSASRSDSYHGADGGEAMRVLRFEPPEGGAKTFRPIHLTQGQWFIGDPDGPLPLYNLPALAGSATVLVCEGEKAAKAAAALGLVATTSAHGAEAARKTDWSPLAGRDVVILRDNDEPGLKYTRDVAGILLELDPSGRLRVVLLPGLPVHGDIVEFIASRRAAGLDDRAIRNEIEALAREATPFADAGCSGGVPPTQRKRGAQLTTDSMWPVLATNALHDLAGDFVRMVSPHSEADHVALLGQFLVEFGNCIGRGPHFIAEADKHYTNLYLLILGRTAKARKGTSHGHVQRVFNLVDEVWSKGCRKQGISSGEGLIWAVRDQIEKEEPIKEKGKVVGYRTVVVDPGVEDKRLLDYESEFAQCLRVLDREGNTLSAVTRNAWDTGDLSILTKNLPARATGAHISVIGHITQDEALRYLDRTEAANGFGNRFLWLCARRSKVLPEGGKLSETERQKLAHRLRMAVEFARTVGEVTRDEEARELWVQVYPELSEGRAGLLGAITARAEAQVMRLALLYALLDQSTVIRRVHLLAGLALWAYAEDSATYVFGSSLGDPVSDEILRGLHASDDGLTRTQIRDLFGRNRGKDEIGRALGVLLRQGLARCEEGEREGPGRRAEVWFAVEGRQATSGIRSWRSYLSYPRASEPGPTAPPDSPGSATTKTTERAPRGEQAAEHKVAEQAEVASQATTQTTETTESDEAEAAATRPPTTETPSTTERIAPVPAADGLGANPAEREGKEELEWSA